MRATLGAVALAVVVLAGGLTAGAAGASGRMPGMGSSLSAFTRAYGVARGPGALCTAKNSCFGPGLRNQDSGRTYRFTAVTITSGIVAGYDENFVKDTAASTVVAAIMRTMPADSTATPIVVDHNGGSCGLFTISGPTLARELGAPKIGDSQGVVGVDLSNVDANLNPVYDPANVQTASLTVVAADPNAGC